MREGEKRFVERWKNIERDSVSRKEREGDTYKCIFYSKFSQGSNPREIE